MAKISFIGSGKMAEALIHSVILSGVNAKDIIASDINLKRLKYIKSKFQYINTTSDNVEAVEKSNIIFLCVKPQQFGEILPQIQSCITSKHLVISIAAGITLKFIERYLKSARVIRTMPNTPVMAGCGVVCYAMGSRATLKDSQTLERLLSKTSLILKIPEKYMNVITAISGSGPAYIFYVAEIMELAARKMGLNEKIARRIVSKTIAGAGKMLLSGGLSPQDLRANVTSPGGTTEAAINYLDENNFQKILISAILKAKKRADKLSK